MSSSPETILQHGLFLGIALTFSLSNLCNSSLYKMRKNQRAFTSIIVGSISCLLYYIFSAPALVFGFSPSTQSLFSSIFWFQAINDFCLFVLLFERLMPTLKWRQRITPKMEKIIKLGIPSGLVLSQLILAGLVSSFGWPYFPVPAYEMKLIERLSSVNAMIGLGCNAFLTILFLRALTENREGTLITIIMNNKLRWLEFSLHLLVGLFLIICRLMSYGTPTGIHPSLRYFTGMAYPVVILATYKDFIFVTRFVAREILQSTILERNSQTSGTLGVLRSASSGIRTGSGLIWNEIGEKES
ncbi:hypothetical protein BKA69DRAFT_1128405 [Paraphysoderma sedebokerense]|nr:hypothetical protein BKA69DRAFT_1128405 [Paraphysoderma sedebokerense]